MKPSLTTNSLKFFGLVTAFLVLSGCASFTGLRTPQYDGEPIVYDEEAAELYEEKSQISSDHADLYYRYELSESLFEPSLSFSDEESVLLEEGTYTVGEDLPEGRVFLESEPSDFRQDYWIIHTGNMTIYDKEEAVVFENHFQDGVGSMTALVDLREGYVIELVGNDPLITVQYSEPSFEEEELEVEESTEIYSLMTGHYEVGEHLEEGSYEITDALIPRTTQFYHFTNQGDINIVELHSDIGLGMSPEENEELLEIGAITQTEYELNQAEIMTNSQEGPILEVSDGDKLYMPMVHRLNLRKE